jgi:hypothetical protein
MARLGGPFPFNQSNSYAVSLVGGGFAYIPPGENLVLLGNNTVLQWWDPVGDVWRGTTAVTGSVSAISTDGYNYRILNVTGTQGAVAVTAAGSTGTNGIGAAATGAAISLSAPVSGRTARAYAIVGGSLPALSVAQAGSGFLVPPVILIDPPPYGGIQATAICTISAGAIATATLVNVGAGYVNLPAVYVVPEFLDYPGSIPLTTASAGVPPNFPPGLIAGGGTGAAAVGGILPPQTWKYGLQLAQPLTSGALINFGAATTVSGSGTLTGVVVVDGGQGYTAVAQTGTVTGVGAATISVATPVAGVTDTSFIQTGINE